MNNATTSQVRWGGMKNMPAPAAAAGNVVMANQIRLLARASAIAPRTGASTAETSIVTPMPQP